MKLSVEYVPITSIKPYENNAKTHPAEQIEQIAKSMQEFGNIDPIGVWNNEIVEGHGRYLAALKLGIEEVPIIRLDELTDEQRKAYALVHNKLTMNSDFDVDLLAIELDGIEEIDMSNFGFDLEQEDLFGAMRDDELVTHHEDNETFGFTLQVHSAFRNFCDEYVRDNGKDKLVEMIEKEVQNYASGR